MTDLSQSPRPGENDLARGFLAFLGLSAAGHIAGFAGAIYLVKAGIITATHSGFDYQVAGTTTIAIGGFGAYKIFQNAARQISALHRISKQADAGSIDATPDERQDRSRSAAGQELNHD